MQLKLVQSKLPFLTPLLLIAPFFLWGTAMVAMKSAIPHTTPLFMVGVRLVPAGVLVLVAASLLGRPQPQGWKAWLWISLFALVDGAMFQGFLGEGLVRTGAGLGSVMIDSQPLAVAILSWLLFKEKINLWGWLGLLIGVLGISLIGLPDETVINLLHNGVGAIAHSATLEAKASSIRWSELFQSGEWLMLLAALSMAVGTVMIRMVCRYADPVVATGWHMVLGGLPLFAISAGWESNQLTNLDLSNWIALGYSTVFGCAIAYALFFYFASRGSLTSLSSLTFLTPVFALLFGNLFLSEFLSSLQWIGVAFTLVSIYLINQRDAIAAKLGSFSVNLHKTPVTQNKITDTNQVSETATQSELVPAPLQLKESETSILQ